MCSNNNKFLKHFKYFGAKRNKVKGSQNRVRPLLEEMSIFVFTNFLSSKTCHFWRVFSSLTSVLIMLKFEREIHVFATEMLGFANKTILVIANFAN